MVLSGMSNLEQLEENVSFMADFKPLDETEMTAIWKVCEVFNAQGLIPCTACKYCVDGCPQNIAIPSAFRFYNEGKKYRNPASQRRMYNRTCANIGDCVECGACSNICPQHLEIPELLKQVRAYIEA